MKLKRFFGILLALSLTLSLFPGIAFGEDTSASLQSVDLSQITQFTFDGDSVTVIEGTDKNYTVTVYDSDDTETDADKSVDGDGNTVYSLSEGSSGELLISIKKAGGSYAFQGQGNGSIAVKKEATGDSYIYLNGLELTSAFTSVITVKKDSTASCIIYAVEGTTNTFTDSEYNVDDTNATAEKAVMKFKDGSNVTITGEGTINITGNAKNGIKANNVLNITGNVTLNVNAVDNAISSENAINISGGTINATAAGGDGIKACADYEAVGDINITGGTITVNSYGDGIQAMQNLTISGGSFDITTYGGHNISSSGYDKDDDNYPSAKGIKASGSYEGADGAEISSTDCKLQISGGTFVLDAADDAIHSDGDVTITGGDYTIASGDDAIHADYINTIGTQSGSDEDLNIYISACEEGIEGATVNVYSGTFKIFASDDCVNAANSDLTRYSFELNIYGGNIYAASTSGDCLDSNGI